MANYQSSYTGEQIDTAVAKINNIVDAVYPVGSIYMSVNSASPAVLFGGTWARITDCFLLASGLTYAPGTTGGEATHTLTINEMPRHQHSTPGGWGAGTTDTGRFRADQNSPQTNWSSSGFTGGGAAHNNMPPYLAVYVWQRTA